MPKTKPAKSRASVDFVLHSSRTKLPDHYNVLGIVCSASEEEILEAYYAKAKFWHPDVGGDSDAFAEISVAKTVLLDKEQRKLYDARRMLLLKPCRECNGKGVTFKTTGFTSRKTVVCAVCKGSGVQKKGAK